MIFELRGRKSPLFIKDTTELIDRNTIEKLAIDRINELDKELFIVDISVSPMNQIVVEIESQSGNVSIDDCIRISRNIEHNLDRETEDFELQVSSPGLDKPFKVFQQYQKNIGRNISLKLNNGQKLEGVLKAVTDQKLSLETSKLERKEGKKKKEKVLEILEFPMDNINEAKIIITFKK